MRPKRDKIYLGHALSILKKFDSESIDMCITSPPYWGLREYRTDSIIWDGDPNCEHKWTEYIQHGKHGGTKSQKVKVKGYENFQSYPDATYSYCKECGAWNGELGREPSFTLYIKHICDIFDEVMRVLKPYGSCWVNIGDTHWGGGNAQGHTINTKNLGRFTLDHGYTTKPIARGSGYKDKCSVLIPERFAIEMVDRGWVLRNPIIWHKPNANVNPVKDRFTVDFEYMYFFVKQRKYYFKQQFTPLKHPNVKGIKFGGNKAVMYGNPLISGREYDAFGSLGRNKRAVWTLNTANSKVNHIAVYPKRLIETPIQAACPTHICNKCQKPAEYVVIKSDEPDEAWQQRCGADSSGEYHGQAVKEYHGDKTEDASDKKRRILEGMKKKKQVLVKCDCNAGFHSGVVLDPFLGSGTTAIEALTQRKAFIGIELNRSYAQISARSIKKYTNQRRVLDWEAS